MTRINRIGYSNIETKKYSTVEVAELVDVSWNTISRWIVEERFYVPPVQFIGRMKIRFWTEEEVEVVRKYKKENYGKHLNPKRPGKKGKVKTESKKQK